VSAFLRVADVAEEVGVSARTVLRWLDAGELPCLRLPGGAIRIPHDAYLAWLEDRTGVGRRVRVEP
jgi:excisionase family DNA binding protein